MSNVRIAVLCPSEIAFRRFMPALRLVNGVEYAGVGVADAAEWEAGAPVEPAQLAVSFSDSEMEKCLNFQREYGGKVYQGYHEILADDSVDAVYLPLPPGLHFAWGKAVLEAGKHLFMEKPFATELAAAEELLELAAQAGLAVRENYMFAFHNQIEAIRSVVEAGEVGDVRLIRIDFGFPFRGANDFRYVRSLGGGALLDCGGYTLKLASMFLGDDARVVASCLNGGRGLEVDLYGSATLQDGSGRVAQVSFGMDNDYRCSIDIWGSDASLYSGRILTAPAGFRPTVRINRNGEVEERALPVDDSFKKSIENFRDCVIDEELRAKMAKGILKQAELVEAVMGGPSFV